MKYLILSDIHGSLPRLNQVIRYFEDNHYDMLVILGDIINYGPRNRIPEGIDGVGVANLLNSLSDRIIAVRGNCDSEVDQMLLEFPCMADYALLVVNGKRIFLTHGHKYNPTKRPRLGIDLLIYGHTHLHELQRTDDGLLVCNTGSITFPKNGNEPTFATIEEDGMIVLRTLEGQVIEGSRI